MVRVIVNSIYPQILVRLEVAQNIAGHDLFVTTRTSSSSVELPERKEQHVYFRHPVLKLLHVGIAYNTHSCRSLTASYLLTKSATISNIDKFFEIEL